MALFEVLPENLLGEDEENHENPQSGQLDCGSKFELGFAQHAVVPAACSQPCQAQHLL